MHQYKNFKVWQKGRELVKKVYQLTQQLPDDERFGLVSQMKRAAISLPANIAEGSGRRTDSDFCRFLDIAYGSSCELETLLLLCVDLSFLSETEINSVNELIKEIQKMIYALKQKLNK